METVGKRLKIARISKGYTLKELADLVYKTSRTIQNYENGTTNIPEALLPRIAEVLDTSVYYLKTGKQIINLDPPASTDKVKESADVYITIDDESELLKQEVELLRARVRLLEKQLKEARLKLEEKNNSAEPETTQGES